ncbi:MAG TPA: biosynthetic-type acetolactate synthase large subunit [Candidatus Bathyarchaeia archaeon]|nr:biosynthetic-type acetolactate synthase large subunit [Candidatus Bathyarchaeia archaeon]
MTREKLSGAEIVVEELKNEGAEVAFGIPGGVLLDLYEVLYTEDAMRHILMRHEQCAAHAADGYARVSGKTGVCIATSGPGATNLVTGLANASMDSTPVVALTGQVPTAAIGSNAFQEASTFTITMPVTKYNFLVKRTEDLPKVLHNAFYIANTGRKGVVLIDLPKDVLATKAEVDLHPKETFAGYKPKIKPNKVQIKKAAEALVNAERPLIIAGGGVISTGATEELRHLAEFLGAPVVTTLMGKGAIPENHPFSLGMAGMHGRIYANKAINECDALLAVGTRFSDRLTGWQLDQFAPDATLIHVDIDAAEINKNIQVDIPIVGDAKLALGEIIKWLEMKKKTANKSVWVQRIKEMHSACEECIKDVGRVGSSISDMFIKEINSILDGNAIVTTEVGQCQMFAAHYYITKKPRTFISSGGLGTMGFGFPAAIGAKVAAPDKKVVDIAGDGSFLMTCQDLATCVENDIPVVVCVFHNRYLGMVRQWQELFFDKRYSHTSLGATPDFVKLADAFGCYGERVEKPDDLKDALHNAFESGKPAVIDMIVGNEDNILPMIPPGGGLTGMIGAERCKHI